MSTPEFPFWHFCHCSNWLRVSLAFIGNTTITVLSLTTPRKVPVVCPVAAGRRRETK
jgi:hypothetical protein